MLFLLFLFTVIAERYAPLRKRPLLFKFPKHIWRDITLYINDVIAVYNNKCQTCKTDIISE